ncbi:uncharacterized protein [Periplaneta americana]|uniref:uncharacterized protein n=1 Tax=Periplaneta americana TaxID=6978 RepID=UPI0037E8E946
MHFKSAGLVFVSVFMAVAWASGMKPGGGQVVFIDRFEDDKSATDNYVATDLKVKKADRTSFKISGPVEFKKDFPADAKIDVTLYEQKSSGEWMKIPGNTEDNFCTFIMKNDMWKEFVHGTDIPVQCPLNKGSYALKNSVIKLKNLPMMSPGCYKANIKITDSTGGNVYSSIIHGRFSKMDGTSNQKCVES